MIDIAHPAPQPAPSPIAGRPLADRAPYDALRDDAKEAVRVGDLVAAEAYLQQALGVAREIGDPNLIDRAQCNLATLAIERGEGPSTLPQLRQVLMKNQDEFNCYLAAYALARAHDLDQKYKKGIFYARIAQERARRLDRPERLASSHNQMGNLLLAESYFDEACAEYEQALQAPELPALHRAVIVANIGYCRSISGQRREGFRLLFESLRSLRRLGAQPWQRYAHLALCYAYLEIGRYRRAAQQRFRRFPTRRG